MTRRTHVRAPARIGGRPDPCTTSIPFATTFPVTGCHPSRSTCRLPLALLCAAAGAVAAHERPSVVFSGFGTLGYAAVDHSEAEYRTGGARDGADASGSFELDTRIGVQADAALGHALSATVQLQARERSDGDVGVEAEWAFLRWRPDDRVAIRAGRMSLPAFAISDYRSVGYANVPIRSPDGLYSIIPLERLDAADVSLEAQTGDTLWGLQVVAGRSSGNFDGTDFDARDFLAVIVDAEHGSARLRLAHSRTDLTLTFEGIEAVRQGLGVAATFDPGLVPARDDFDRDRVRTIFEAIGGSYDPGHWFVDGEYVRRRIDGFAANVDGWAVSAGWRLGAFTPYALASAYRDVDPDRRVQLPPLEQLAPLQGLLDGAYTKQDQRSFGVSLRWDVAPNIALKSQVEHVASRFTGVSLYRSSDDTRAPSGTDVTLLAISMDVLF